MEGLVEGKRDRGDDWWKERRQNAETYKIFFILYREFLQYPPLQSTNDFYFNFIIV